MGRLTDLCKSCPWSPGLMKSHLMTHSLKQPRLAIFVALLVSICFASWQVPLLMFRLSDEVRNQGRWTKTFHSFSPCWKPAVMKSSAKQSKTEKTLVVRKELMPENGTWMRPAWPFFCSDHLRGGWDILDKQLEVSCPVGASWPHQRFFKGNSPYQDLDFWLKFHHLLILFRPHKKSA